LYIGSQHAYEKGYSSTTGGWSKLFFFWLCMAFNGVAGQWDVWKGMLESFGLYGAFITD
jgi:hypothetical protein